MTERAMSEEAMLAGLRDIRLPAEAAGGALAETAAAAALAGAAALALAAVFRLLSQQRTKARPDRLADRIAALQNLPQAEQRIALLHLLKAHAPERFAILAPDLYRPDGGPDLSQLRAEVGRLG